MGGFYPSEQAKKYVMSILETRRISQGGYFHQKFEKGFAEEHDCKAAVFVNSGTSALQVALQALKEIHGWADRDEVIVPAITFIATSNVVLHCRMIPVFVDVDPMTYNIDTTKIEAKITPRTRAIMPVHLCGLPADMDEVTEIAKRYGLKVIEDSCETMFARYKGRKVGSLGDIGCFSTYVAHFIVTGIGGLATTNDLELATRLRSLPNHGRDSIYISIDDDNVKGAKLLEIMEKRFQFVSVGHSFRATEFEAALGWAQLEEKNKNITRRLAIAHKLHEGLREYSEHLQLPTCPPDRDHMYMMFPMLMRDRDITPLLKLLEEKKIDTRYLMPLLNQPVYRKIFGDIEAQYPVARYIGKSGFYIPCHPGMSDEDVDYVLEQFRTYFKSK